MDQFFIIKLNLLLPLLFLFGCNNQKKKKVESDYDIQNAFEYENVIPIAIVGTGPAGLTAAMYVSRAGIRSIVFEGPSPKGQLIQTTYVENWPGLGRILGPDLMNKIESHALSFGGRKVSESVSSIEADEWPFKIKTENGHTIRALSVILCTGATPKRLNIPGESEYWGNGVTTCAKCDAPFCEEKQVVVVGGGDSAAEMTFSLASHAKKVTILVRGDKMRATAAMQDRLAKYQNVSVLFNKSIKEIKGDGEHIVGITFHDNKDDKDSCMKVDYLFLAIGHTPNTEVFKGEIPLNPEGFIKMEKRSQKALIPGLFAAGENQDPVYRQAIVASGEGAKAGIDTSNFLFALGFNPDIGDKLDQRFYQGFSENNIKLKEIVELPDFDKEVTGYKGVAILDVYGEACSACVKILPILESLMAKYDGKLNIVKADFDKITHTIGKVLLLAYKVKVKRLPTLFIFKNGQFVKVFDNVVTGRELAAFLSDLID